MADPQASLVITLKDLASKGLKSLGDTTESLRKNFLAVGAAVAAFTAFAYKALEAAAEQESAEAKLAVALKNQGDARESTKKAMVDYAAELQKTTAFTDDSLIQNQALLVSFGLMGDELKGSLRAAMELSAARNIDLATASMLLGKAYQGNTETLKRYGIEISANVKEGDKFKAVLDAINGAMGGSVQAQAKTFAGQMTILKNAFSELYETIGFSLMPVARQWMTWLKDATIATQNYWAAIERVTGANRADMSVTQASLSMLREKIKVLAAERNEIRSGDPAKMSRLSLIDEEIVRTHNLIRALEQKAKAEKESPSAPGSSNPPRTPIDEDAQKADAKNAADLIKHKEQLAQKASDIVDSAVLTGDKLAEIQSIRLENELRAMNMVVEADAVKNARLLAQDRATNAARLVAANSALTALASLQNAKSKEMAAVGRAAATTQTMIATIVASMEAYKALAGIPIIGPILGAAAAASIMTAGTAKVAQINGMPLAEGGMVLPTAGGTRAVIGEAGGREAVLPLDNPQSMEAIRQALGGSGGGITIQAGIIVADDVSLEELARRIDAKLFTLHKNRGSAFGD